MIKILFVHQNLETGGAEKIRYLVLKYLNKARYDVEVCCLGSKGEMGESIEKLGYKVFSFNQRINLFNPGIFFKLYRLIRRGKYDIVQSSLFYANYYSRITAFIAGVKVILAEEHGIYLWKSKHKIFIIIDRILSRGTTKIISCSETVRRFTAFQEKIPRSKILTIHNFVDNYEVEALSTSDKMEMRRKSHLPTNTFLIGIIGTFRIEKGHRYLFQALARLDFSDYKLIVVGNGPLERELKEDVSRLGISDKVLFMDKSYKVSEIMRVLDVLVIPSEREGLPVVLLEAMAYSLPVIASKISGIKEVIVNNETGLLVPKKDPDKLSLALSYLKNNPEISRKFIESARATVKRKYSKDVYLDKLEHLYGLVYV